MSPTRRTAIALGAGALAAACTRETPETGLRRLRFATDWRAQAEHGGFYQAVATGLYRARGLDVAILQGGPGSNVPQLLAAGAVELGLGSQAFMPLNLVQAGAPVRAVQASFQKDPQVLITHPREDVAAIADMRGKPIMISDAAITAWWPWAKARFGFTDDQVRKYTYSLAPFLADPKAIQQGYVTSEPYTIAEQGVTPEVYLLADEGFPGYAALTLAPQSLIDSEPETVRAFVEATAEGWRSYLAGDPAPADGLILKDNPDMRADILAQAREKLLQYAILGDEIGAMSEARWAEFFEAMSAVGLYPADLDWRRAFTLDFLDGAASG